MDARLGTDCGEGDGYRVRGLEAGFESCMFEDLCEDIFPAENGLAGEDLPAETGRRDACSGFVGAGVWLFGTFPLLFDGGLPPGPWRAPRVIRLPPCRNSSGIALMRPDFRRPPSVKDVGPSASTLFHGGDSIFGRRGARVGVVLRKRRRFDGLSSSSSAVALNSSSSPVICNSP
jgi:hypothetical protein